MQGGFEKFRKKQARITLINALIWGLAALLLAAGTLLLIDKLSNASLHTVLYVLIPLAAFMIAAGAGYLFFRKQDKTLAKGLDEEFALNERVQTMLEFRDVQTDMVRLQRKDAQERLEKLPVSGWKWKGTWSCVAALVCAAAIFVTGLAIPKRTDADNQPQKPEIVFEITDDQKTKLATLIANVKNSNAEEEVRTAILTELNGLQLALDDMQTANELYEELRRIITSIDDFVEGRNTYKRVYNAIRGSSTETVQQFAIGIGLNDFATRFDALRALLQNEEEDNGIALTAIATFTTDLKLRFDGVEESEEDALVIAIANFIADMESVAALDPTVYTYERVFDNVTAAFNGNTIALASALTQQTDNRSVTNATVEQLIAIFKLPANMVPEWGGEKLEGLQGEEETDPDTPPEHGDGIIVDGIVYPSNEKVYDYYTKVICEYGKVFEGDAHNYKAAMNELIAQGVADGTISPETEEMLRSYLDALSGSEVSQT